MAIKRPMNKRIVTKAEAIPPDPFTDDATGNWRAELDATLDVFSLKNLFYSETWVYVVVNIIARKIANQLMPVHKRIISKGELTTVPDMTHFLNIMMEKPNDHEDYHAFMYKVGAELTLMGNAIIWRLRFSNQLILLPTELLDVRFDEDTNEPSAYMMMPGLTEEHQGSAVITIHPDDIIHITLPHPNSMIFGLSPFVSGRKSVLFDRYSSEFLNNFYLKQANPGLILEMEQEANEKKAVRLLKSMENLWTGRRNLRRTMLLPKGVKSVVHAQTLAEQDLKEHILLKRDEIRALLNMPPHELGLQSAGSMGSEEAKTAILNFWESTIIPFQGLISGTFTKGFKKALGAKHLFQFDNSDVKILKADEKLKAETAILKLHTHTINEIRREDYDKPPIEGGDRLGGRQSTPGPGGFPFQSVSGPMAQIPQLLPPGENQVGDSNQSSTSTALPTQAFINKFNDWWMRRKQQETERADFTERKIFQSVLDLFLGLAPKVMDIVSDNYEEPLGLQKSQKANSDIPNELDRAFSEFEATYTSNGTRVLRGVAELGYDIQLDTPFGLPNEEEIQALRQRNEEERLDILEARQLTTFKNITQSTTNDIMRIIRRGSENSFTLPQVAREIQTYFSEIIPSRARTIARTETLTAVSLGQKAAQDDASSLLPGMKKMWISAGDDRVRDSHVDLDGVIVNVDEEFKSGLAFPRDPNAPANETINCRCTWIMIPEEDSEDIFDFTGITGRRDGETIPGFTGQ